VTSDTCFGYRGIPANGRHELGYLSDASLADGFTKHPTSYGDVFGQGIVSSNFAGSDADYGYVETTGAF